MSPKFRFTFTLAILTWIILSPVVLAASGEEGGGWGWIETIGKWFNLAILVGALVYLLRRPLIGFLVKRRKSIQEEIREAHQAKDEANRKLSEMESRLQNLDQELEEIRIQAEQDAESERQRIIEEGEKEAAKLLQTALREIGGLTSAAKQDLKAYAGRLSIDLARKQVIKDLDPESEQRVIDRFLVEVSGINKEAE